MAPSNSALSLSSVPVVKQNSTGNSNRQLLKLLTSKSVNEDASQISQRGETYALGSNCTTKVDQSFISTSEPSVALARPVAVTPQVKEMIKHLDISVIRDMNLENTPFFNEHTNLAARALPVPFL